MTVAAPRRVELVGIQYLRGIAAFMVVVFHVHPQVQRMGYAGPWPTDLSSGVDIFFVISGIIMWVTTFDRPITPWQFWQRRLTRIVPLYWLFTACMVLLLTVAPRLMQSSQLDWPHAVASFLFVPWMHPVHRIMQPVVVPGWTLNYEMLFYLVFGLFLFVPQRWRFAGVAAVLVMLVLIGAAAGVDERTTALGFYTSSVMLEFLFGMGIGVAVTRGAVLPGVPVAVAGAMLIGGLVVLIVPPAFADQPRALVRGLPATVAVAGMLALEARGRVPRIGWLHRLGESSYSLYLVHIVALSAFGQAWRKLGLTALPATYALFTIAACIGSVIVGSLCYRLVEQPLTAVFHPTRWGRALVGWRRRRAPVTVEGGLLAGP